MELQDIEKELHSRFSQPLPEFYQRRIIFWQDSDKEFAEDIDSLAIPNVNIIKMAENNQFYIKKLLSYDDQENDYLVYCPIKFESNEDNWITDIMKYSESFSADLISIQMVEMELTDTIQIRETIKKYPAFFNAKKRRELIKRNKNSISSPDKLRLAIMSAIAGSKMNSEAIIKSVVKAGLVNDENPIYQDFEKYKIAEDFWNTVKDCTGYQGYQGEYSLKNMFVHITLTAASRTIDQEAFLGLDGFISAPHELFCFQLIDDWVRDTSDKDVIYDLTRNLEDEMKLMQRLTKLPINSFIKNEVFPGVDEVILTKVMEEIAINTITPKEIISICDSRRVGTWYDEFQNYYQAISQVANMKTFYEAHQSVFHFTEPEELWNQYADKLYLMDTYYRKFQMAFQSTLMSSNTYLDDLLKRIVEQVEGIYKNWYLENLLTNWCNVAKHDLANFGYIPALDQQVDFYNTHIRNQKNRTFVIISDAMRYEVAKELAEELEKNMACQIEMKNMESVFPSITKFGMAALLPNKGLETTISNSDDLKILINGESTDAPNREKVLQTANPKSVALKYDSFIPMKREERKELVKGMEVIYIYHDRIDSTSHTSDTQVFTACHDTISELKNLVRILVNEFSATNIKLTSDHGFLYTYHEFTEEDKLQKEGFSDVVEIGRRYAIMGEDAEPSYLMPIHFLDEEAGLQGFAPKQNIRIKKKGGGINFVHGGISLQETMVPLIEYRHTRSDSKEYKQNRQKYEKQPVELILLSQSRKVSNMIFNLSFYQNELISANREAATYTAYFVDSNNAKVSDEVTIIADRESEDAKELIFEATFNLKAGKYDNKQLYYLVIIENSGEILPKKIEFSIDIPFATGEYNFF